MFNFEHGKIHVILHILWTSSVIPSSDAVWTTRSVHTNHSLSSSSRRVAGNQILVCFSLDAPSRRCPPPRRTSRQCWRASRIKEFRRALRPSASGAGRREWEHARHDVENPSSSRAGGDDSPSCAVGTMTTHPPFRTAYTDSAPGSDVRSRRGRIRHRRWAERQPEEPHAHGTHPRSNVGSATAGKSVPSTL